jgi:hypothetical protein
VATRLRWKDGDSVSFSAPDWGFGDFLWESFAALRAELPGAYATFSSRLAPRTVALCVDGESVSLRFAPRAVERAEARAPADIEAVTSKAAILAVVDADATLVEAILDDRLILRGHCDDLLAFHDGLLTYVHGAVRAPSFPRLLRAFRRSVAVA